MRELLARLRDWMRRDRLDSELREELAFHRALLERDGRAAGITTDDGVWEARRRLGNTTRIAEDTRDRWSVPWLDHLQQDVRYALRGLRRSPAFAIPVILTLGLGIGANAAMFGVVDRLMFRPDPYLRDPGSVDRVYLQERDNTLTTYPYTRYLDLTRWSTAFSHTAAFVSATHGVGTRDAARERGVLGVSASFFEFFDARPALGRFFIAADDSLPTGANVAILSHGLWQSDFGGRNNVIGESILVGNAQYTIIGVAPEHFVGISETVTPAVFVPITAWATNQGSTDIEYYRGYNWDWVEMIVRRKPGVTRPVANADLTSAFLRSWDASRLVHPRYPTADVVRPRAVAGALKMTAGPKPGLEARTLVWVMGVAAIVLGVACANVANLFLARAMRRRREIALRRALGVSRGRLTAQAFTETTVLALLGCGAGILIAQWGGAAIRRLFLSNMSSFDVISDWRTVAVASLAALGAALVTGIAPVFFAGREELSSVLKSGAREGTNQRSTVRSTLLVMQVALSVVLLVGAGVFVQSLMKVRSQRLGYDIAPLLLVRWEARGTPLDSSDQVALRARVLEAARARPDVERGAWVTNVAFARGTSTLILNVPGVDSVSRLGRFTFQTASADYFATMNTRLLRGRTFTDADRASTPRVAVVSEAMARRLWPNQEALGKCMRVTWRSTRPDTMPCTAVVGVVENAVHDPVADHPMRYYLPDTQLDFRANALLLRMRRDPGDAAEEVRSTLQAVMPGNSLVTVRPAHELVDAKRRSWLVGATLFVGFGALALIVAAVGLYGVIAYTVAQRMHELGVRIALGAQSRDVVRLVVGQGARFAAVGLLVGGALALVAARWVQPLLFEQSARDPLVFAGVAALLVVVAIVASGLPASKATRADPNTVLRAD